MEAINDIISKLELVQICWNVKDIHAAVDFSSKSLGIPGFLSPELVRAQDLGMCYRGEVVDGEWHMTQAYNTPSPLTILSKKVNASRF